MTICAGDYANIVHAYESTGMFPTVIRQEVEQVRQMESCLVLVHSSVPVCKEGKATERDITLHS